MTNWKVIIGSNTIAKNIGNRTWFIRPELCRSFQHRFIHFELSKSESRATMCFMHVFIFPRIGLGVLIPHIALRDGSRAIILMSLRPKIHEYKQEEHEYNLWKSGTKWRTCRRADLSYRGSIPHRVDYSQSNRSTRLVTEFFSILTYSIIVLNLMQCLMSNQQFIRQ